MSGSNSTSALASEALKHFTVVKRGDDSILTLKDDRPEWVYELVYSAHGDMLPDDYIYEYLHEALVAIARADDDTDLDDAAWEFGDDVDIMNADLLKWVGSNLNRMSYVDEAMQDLGHSDDLNLARVLMLGQSLERREVFESVRQSLETRSES